MIDALRRAFRPAVLMALLCVGTTQAQTEQSVLAVPYGVGERLEYTVYFGKLKAGNGSMEVKDIQDVRGRDAWHAVWELHGGLRFVYHIDDVFATWIDRRTGNSLRFYRDQNEGRRDKESTFEMYPERSLFQESGDTLEAGVANPLDDASFLYFVRTIPLVVGETHSYNRYFRPDRNPVTLKVLRKDTIEVAGRRWPAVVVQPTFKSSGPFSENGRAELWFSDDRNRIMLQMKSSLPFGSINLYLTSYRPAPAAPSAP
jgi:hypothetical protein